MSYLCQYFMASLSWLSVVICMSCMSRPRGANTDRSVVCHHNECPYDSSTHLPSPNNIKWFILDDLYHHPQYISGLSMPMVNTSHCSTDQAVFWVFTWAKNALPFICFSSYYGRCQIAALGRDTISTAWINVWMDNMTPVGGFGLN